MKNFKRKAFTLVELLVVIAIIGILFVVLISKVDFATEKAKASGVQTDFRSYQLAIETVARENAGLSTLVDDAEGDAKYAALEAALNKNLDPKLHVEIDADGKISTEAKDPWKERYLGAYLAPDADGTVKDRGAIVMYSKGSNLKLGSTAEISNGVVNVTVESGKEAEGADDYSVYVIYTMLNGNGNTYSSTSGFNTRQETLSNPNLNAPNTNQKEDLLDLSEKNKVEMLDGDFLTYDKTSPTILSFRSPAEIETFEAVMVDSNIVSSQYYVVTEGSTIVTFNEEWSAMLSIGTHTVDIVSNTMYAQGIVKVKETNIALNPINILPEGAVYKTRTGTTYESGDLFPEDVFYGDTYTYGDYLYSADGSKNWKVSLNLNVTDKTKERYGEILETINGKPIVSVYELFRNCNNLVESPNIPDTVTNMGSTFEYCYSLLEPPKSPSSLTQLYRTYYQCKAMTYLPEIPDGVTTIYNAFAQCILVTSAPSIPSSVQNMEYAFSSCFALQIPPDMSKATGITSMKAAFMNCSSLTTGPVIVSTMITDMAHAFYGCKMMTVAPQIPSSVTSATAIFYDCQLLNTYHGSSDSLGDFSNYVIPVVPSYQNAFQNCKQITKAPNIPNGVENLIQMFYGCTALTNAPNEIPESVTTMYGMFNGCEKLVTAPVINGGSVDMGYAFYKCTSLSGSITINIDTENWTACLFKTAITEILGTTTKASNYFNTKSLVSTNP